MAAEQPDYSSGLIDVTSEIPVCQGTLDALDFRTVALGEALDLEVTRRIPLILNAGASESCEGDNTVFGCARANGEVVAVPSTTYHELAHGVACELGRSDRLYEEGFATAFDGTAQFASEAALTNIAESVGGSPVNYTTAGHFIRWLHAQHGPGAVADAYERTGLSAGKEGFDAVFASVFDEDIQAAEQRFRAERPFFVPAAWDRCTGPLVEWAGEALRIDATLDCSSPGTLGPYLERQLRTMTSQSMYSVFTVEGRDDTEYVLQLDGREGVWVLGDPIFDWGVRVEECHPTPMTDLAEAEQTDAARFPTYATIHNANARGFEFLPGKRYRVELISPMEEGPRQLRAEFVRLEDSPPSACMPPIPDATCDPRTPASCADGWTCAFEACTFACVDGAGDLDDGEPCSGSGAIGECSPSSVCVPAAIYPECTGPACCTAYCDMSGSLCAGGLECFPVFSDGAAPDGLETLGTCAGV